MATALCRYVFVYGTLKRNQPNHHWLSTEGKGVSKFISEGKTQSIYPLVIASNFNIPFLLHCEGRGHNVSGEVYEVDETMLTHLDVLESHPDFYVRETVPIRLANYPEGVVCDEGGSLTCWLYFLKSYKPELLERPHLLTYDSRGEHGLPYVESDFESRSGNKEETRGVVKT